MITRADIEERVREWGLREDVVEKDYVIGWLLWGIGSDPVLGEQWVFKGGTCLKKCFIETYRFSEDLDFTVLPAGPASVDALRPLLSAVLERVAEESGIDFSQRVPALKANPSGTYTEGRVYYTGPRRTPTVGSVKLDLSASEVVARPAVPRPISHAYPDALPEPATVRCYCFEELFAEKVRAMGERGRPRDLYDIVNLYRRQDLGDAVSEVRAVLIEKCRTKGVQVPTFESIKNSQVLEELESEWGNMLAHQLPALPPFADFWQELPRLFAWLNGTEERPALPAIPVVAGEAEDGTWVPPPIVRAWGLGVPLETIRFAALNHLCVELGYRGSVRTVEPYSLRRTSEGNIVLHALRVDTREHRSYRVDRIESVRVMARTFVPVYQIEFSSSGVVHTPKRALVSRAAPRLSPRRSGGSGLVYLVQCSYCQKQFRRRDMRDTELNEHKGGDGRRCHGSRRRGIFVGTKSG